MCDEEDGASSVEYSLLALLVAGTVIAAVVFHGEAVRDDLFERSNDCIERTVDCG